MGTWQTFDVRGARDQALAAGVVEEALDLGVDMFDSSPMYGQSEQVLGAALGAERPRALIATKVWARSLDEGRRQTDAALRFFGNRIDLYQVQPG